MTVIVGHSLHRGFKMTSHHAGYCIEMFWNAATTTLVNRVWHKVKEWSNFENSFYRTILWSIWDQDEIWHWPPVHRRQHLNIGDNSYLGAIEGSYHRQWQPASNVILSFSYLLTSWWMSSVSMTRMSRLTPCLRWTGSHCQIWSWS